jgi:hypothetical protein
MAETVLVKEPLTPEMAAVGERFVQALDKSGFIAKAALWYFDPDAGGWKLLLATPDFAVVGPAVLYRKAIKVLDRLGRPFPLQPDIITIVNTKHPLIQTIATMINTGPTISRVRFTDNTINGIRIADAYIYRVDVQRGTAVDRHTRQAHQPT